MKVLITCNCQPSKAAREAAYHMKNRERASTTDTGWQSQGEQGIQPVGTDETMAITSRNVSDWELWLILQIACDCARSSSLRKLLTLHEPMA